MAKSTRSKQSEVEETCEPGIPRGWGEFLGVALLAIGGLMAGGLFSYQFGDGNLMGPVGRLVASALYSGFGMAGYLIVLGVVGVGVKALLGHRMELNLGEGVGFSAATLAGCVLLHVSFPSYRAHGFTAGGLSGELLGEVSIGLFDLAGTYLLTVTVLTLGLIASTPLSFSHLGRAGRAIGGGARWLGTYLYSGVVGIARAQRDYAEDSWEDEEDGGEEEEDDENEGEGEGEDAEAWEELEARAEAGEFDTEDGEEEDEDSDADADDADDADAEPEVSSRRARKAKRAATASKGKGKGARKNKKRQPTESAEETEETEEADEADETEDEADLAASVERPSKSSKPKSGKSNSSKPKTGADRPEICISKELGESEDQDGAPTEAGSGKSARKQASLTPAELAARKRADRADAAARCHGAERKREGAQPVQYTGDRYELPPLHLFASVAAAAKNKTKTKIDTEFIYRQSDAIVEAFAHFKIRGKVTKIHPGPVITRYEFKPEAGVKVSRIQNLENDLAMALEAIRIRILAPIPGKSTVGLEVPNKTRETVYVQENLADPTFLEEGKTLPLVLGKDIVGKAVAIDLGKAPHLLVAGATGSGKSVGVNSMLCSLLYSCTPEDLRMILIDPKMLEFSIYQDIPHLLLPVITDAEKANLALRWAVNEMERRYALLSLAKVRGIKGFNDKLPQLQAEWDAESKAIEAEAASLAAEALVDGEDSINGALLSGVQFDAEGNAVAITGGVELPARPERMPYIVIVIDEFADLMMVASKEVEANVSRLAAKARAAGIHLILATQRPSVDVITGTIKNNFPSRIAFQVTSDIDSRTILDQKGAKQLLGMGDMLYMDRGKEPRRVHGCFVSEAEIEKVVAFVRRQAKPAYNMEITKADASDGDEGNEQPIDPLYDKAVQIVAEAGKVSTSMLQRRLNVGYNRAAKIVDRMEDEGAIGPANGSKPREVYISAA